MTENKPFVANIDPKLAAQMKVDLKSQGFDLSTPPHTLFSAKKKGVVCTLYHSGKLVVQGSDSAELIEYYIEPEILKEFSFTYQDLNIDTHPHIGVDESGKGDFFGPLCVAALYAGGDEIKKLKSIGVQDSKNLSDSKVLEIGRKIQSSFHHHIVKINPAKYNEIYVQFGNLNSLLAWGHATVIEKLMEHTGCSTVMIDQFANESVVLKALGRKKLKPHLTQRHRAEEDLVVAGASILARQTFLEGLEKLSKEFEVKLPKGASLQVIKAGKELVRKHGKEVLGKVGKLHFKTTNAILGIVT